MQDSRKSRFAANVSLTLAALCVGFLVAAFWGSWRLHAASMVFSALALFAGAWSVAINSKVPLPRPARPVVALLVSLVLAGIHALIWLLLSSLSKNH